MKYKNVAEKIKQILINYDLEIEAAKTQLKKANTQVYCFKNSKQLFQKNRYYDGVLNQVKYKEYIKQLQEHKKEFLDKLTETLQLYYLNYYVLWIEHFINNIDIETISKKHKIHVKTVRKILKMINKDLINYLN